MHTILRNVLLAIGFALFIAAIVAFTVGVVQNHYFQHQLDNCRKYDASEKFTGYDCGSHTIYVPKQQ